jgi:2-methylcitrate dehydratase
MDIIANDPEKWAPNTRETADHSLPYCTAVALLDGVVTEAQFEHERIIDPELRALVARVRVHRDPDCERRYPGSTPNRLAITLDDGRQLVREVEFPRGHARNPMTDAEVENKFHHAADRRFGQQKANAILQSCWDLDRLNDARELVQLLEQTPP